MGFTMPPGRVVIVGNIIKQRPDPFPEGYKVPRKKAIEMLKQGGQPGPQLFNRKSQASGQVSKTRRRRTGSKPR